MEIIGETITALENFKTADLLDKADFWFNSLGDAMSNIALTICCVLLLSYLRQATPNLKVNSRFIGLLTLPALSGFLQRFAARVERTNDVPKFEDFLKALLDKAEPQMLIKTYSQTLVFTFIPSVIAFVCICTAALGIMNVHKKKHAVPMLGVLLFCLALRFLFKELYKSILYNSDVLTKISYKLCNVKIDYNEISMVAYELFFYGIFTLIAAIIYVSKSKQLKGGFGTVAPAIAYVLSSTVIYTAFTVFANIIKLPEGFKMPMEHIPSENYYVTIKELKKLDNFSQLHVFPKWYNYIYIIGFSIVFILMHVFLVRGLKHLYRQVKDDVFISNKDDKIREEATSFNKRSKEMVKFEHDLSNNLRMIEETASKEKAFTTSGLVHSMLEDLYEAQSGFVSGNEFLNTILSTKKKEIEKSSTEISFEGIFPEKGIDNYDISTIMCNALDNAIEACMQTDEPSKIIFVSKIVGDYVYFKISNPYKKIKTDGKKNLITTKADNSYHGYGMKKIEETVKKYDGNLDITHEKNTFTLSAKMRYQNSEA